MQIKDYQRTLKAIQVALKDVDYNNKSDMKMRLIIISGFVDNAMEEQKAEPLTYEQVYDDESPSAIIGTEDGI